jgi:hypothetical protein
MALDGRGSFGSLVLGGYDERRMMRNDIMFPFHEDVLQVHTVWVENITWMDSLKGNHSFDLSRTNFTTHIDSSRPFIYLPPSIYDDLIENINIPYDNETDTLHLSSAKQMELKKQNLGISFTLAPLNRGSAGSSSVTITLPFESLILEMSFPASKKRNQSEWYVPIRKATDPSQYVLGRAFFQHTYLVSDYERRTFSIHQAKLQEGTAPDPLIRPILVNKTVANSLDSWKPTKLSRSMIAGITVGILFAVSMIVSIICYLLFKRKNKQHDVAEKPTTGEQSSKSDAVEVHAAERSEISGKSHIPEVDTTTVYESSARQIYESSGNEILEMPDTSTTFVSKKS